MRRAQPTENKEKIYFEGFNYDFGKRALISPTGRIDLPPKPSEILAMLLQSPGELVSRDEIASQVWRNQVVDFDQNINFCIKQIRQALKDNPKTPCFIETVPRKGYRFVAPLTHRPGDPSNQKKGFSDSARLKSWSIFLLTGLIFGLLISYTDFLSLNRFKLNSAEQASGRKTSNDVEQIIKRAYYLYNQGGKANYQRSQSLFEQALKTEPSSGEAHAGLALLKLFHAQSSASHLAVIEHANKALELAPQSANANLINAKISLYWQWDIVKAREYFTAATQLDPKSIEALHDLAVVATIQGDLDVAEASIQQALAVDPGRFQEHYHAGWFYQVAKKYDLALKQCIQSLEIEPDHRYSLLCAGRSALKLDLSQTASHYLEQYLTLAKEKPAVIQPIVEALNQGDIAPFNHWYIDWLKADFQDPFQLALAYAELGHVDKALASLQAAVESKHVMVPTAWAFDELAPLRKDPRFAELMTGVRRF